MSLQSIFLIFRYKLIDMIKGFYISPMRSNSMIDETMTGKTIKIEGLTYAEVSRAPRGKRVLRKLSKEDGSEQIKIYH